MLYRRIRYWLNSANRQTELRDEMESHIEETAAQLIEQGLSESDARAEARRRFGSGLLKQEQAREVWIARCWSDAFQDLRYALRLMGRNPALTITALLSLAIAIGMNTATFTLIDAVLLRELRVQHPEDLVLLAERAGSRQVFSFSSPAFHSLAESGALTGLSAFRPWRVRTEINGTWLTEVLPGWQRSHRLAANDVPRVFVTAVSRTGIESPTVEVRAAATSSVGRDR